MRKNKLVAAAVGVIAALLVAVPGFAASQSDGNNDGLRDRWEKRHDLSPQVKQGEEEPGADGLRNGGEFRRGTDPRDADSDNNGIEDRRRWRRRVRGQTARRAPVEEPVEQPSVTWR
jgi:hypothetical protein